LSGWARRADASRSEPRSLKPLSDRSPTQGDPRPSSATLTRDEPFGPPEPATTSRKIEWCVATSLREVEGIWRDFEREAVRTVFQTYDILAAWQHHIGARRGVTPLIAIGYAGNNPIILLPLALERRKFLRQLKWLGEDMCDYNAPILATNFADHVEPGQFPALWNGIVDAVQAVATFDVLTLRKMPERIGPLANPVFGLRVLPATYSAHAATLGNNWEEFYTAKVSTQRRATDRRKFKRLSEIGAIRLVELRDPGEIADAIELMIRQKRRNNARVGAADIFGQPGYREFCLAVATDPGLNAIAHVSRLDVADQVAAIGLGLQFRGRYHFWIFSYEDNDNAKYSPGRLHLQALMRGAIDRRMGIFDFTIGDEPYKFDWCDIKMKMIDGVKAVTLPGVISMWVDSTLHRAGAVVRSVPVLRQGLGTIRHFVLVRRNRIGGEEAR
jgi:CelD/BcsL family acetyltransferase involved in cellulose biosynthesis